jgi:septum formation protein
MTFDKRIEPYKIVLGSKSPRRKYLLEELGIKFEVRAIECDESHPAEMLPMDVAPYLAQLKGNAYRSDLNENDILITADTVVDLDDEILNKPKGIEHAYSMLKKLSGRSHLVHTGVCLSSTQKQNVFSETTEVTFHTLSDEEIHTYIETCKPFDKAGSYGIQEWMGYVGMKKVDGDFFSVMGLPLQLFYRELNEFIG